MGVPILTYHAMRIHGNAYAYNDLAALAADLHVITESGFEIRPLPGVISQWLESPGDLEAKPTVALACDDGSDFDAVRLVHPSWGEQRSVLEILADYRARHASSQPHLHITSFVVVSSEARTELDRTCMLGRGWWNESWWSTALASGLMSIGNHSWDHNHPTLAQSCGGMARPGAFATIDSRAAADFEIRQADEYLRRHAPNPGTRLFAYPYGETNAYLAREYLPKYADGEGAPGFDAAFTTEPACLSSSSDRWRIPRFTCGRDWKSPAQLRAILRKARSS